MTLYTALRPGLKKKISRELRGKIVFREKIANVAKRYEKQASAAKKSEKSTARIIENRDKFSDRSKFSHRRKEFWDKKHRGRRKNLETPKEKTDKRISSEPTYFNCGKIDYIRPNCDKL